MECDPLMIIDGNDKLNTLYLLIPLQREMNPQPLSLQNRNPNKNKKFGSIKSAKTQKRNITNILDYAFQY